MTGQNIAVDPRWGEYPASEWSDAIVQSMRLVLRFGQQFGDFLLKGLRPAHQTALSLGSESRRERCSLP